MVHTVCAAVKWSVQMAAARQRVQHNWMALVATDSTKNSFKSFSRCSLARSVDHTVNGTAKQICPAFVPLLLHHQHHHRRHHLIVTYFYPHTHPNSLSSQLLTHPWNSFLSLVFYYIYLRVHLNNCFYCLLLSGLASKSDSHKIIHIYELLLSSSLSADFFFWFCRPFYKWHLEDGFYCKVISKEGRKIRFSDTEIKMVCVVARC